MNETGDFPVESSTTATGLAARAATVNNETLAARARERVRVMSIFLLLQRFARNAIPS
jgi:hypothetical protein